MSPARISTPDMLRQGGKVVRQAMRDAVNLLYPPCCVFCDGPLVDVAGSPNLCPQCIESFIAGAEQLCPRCANPVDCLNWPTRCARCFRRQYYFDSAVALGVYRDDLRLAIRRTKTPRHDSLTRALGRLLSERVERWCGSDVPQAVIPVPMHWMRRLGRGNNGAEVLARMVANNLKVPLWTHAVKHSRSVRKQGTLSPADRFRNVRSAFCATGRCRVRNADLLIVDDVMTTGATASEIARALRRAGAARVRVAVVGRGAGTG